VELPEQLMLDIDGATIEVGLAGTGEPVICQSHPFGVITPEYDPGWGWESGMGRLVAVNPRGVGRSSGQQPWEFTWRQRVDDLEEVRRRLGVDRWVFWGASAGAAIALLYVLAYPESLLGVVVAQMGPSGRRIFEDSRCEYSPNDPANRQVIASTPPLARHPAILRDLRPELASAEWLQLREDFWVLTTAGRPLAVCPSGDIPLRVGWEEFATTYDVQDRLTQIRVPTLVVASGQDRTLPLPYTELLRDGIPQVEYAVFPESGHNIDPASDEGAAYRATARRFLGRIRPS
jgi:pimeloyl-ACP methyl ester carboxylesterase